MEWRPASELPEKGGRYLAIWWDAKLSLWNVEFVQYSAGEWRYFYDYTDENVTSSVRWWCVVTLPSGVSL